MMTKRPILYSKGALCRHKVVSPFSQYAFRRQKVVSLFSEGAFRRQEALFAYQYT